MSGKEVLRAAIIGCGFIAGRDDRPGRGDGVRSHAQAYWRNPATKLVAVADLDIGRAQEFAQRWRVPAAYARSRAMLREESPDVVSVCTPDETHLEILQECLDSSSVKAVWCEKPLGTDIRAAECIVSAYQRRGVVLAVNYQRRWDRLMAWVKGAVHKGELGKIQKVVVYYSKGILHNGSHAVDLLVDWFGPLKRAQVLAKTYDFTRNDPTVDARIVFGEVPVDLVGLNGRHYGIFEVHLLGTQGRMTIEDFGRTCKWFLRESGSAPDGPGELAIRPIVRRRRHPIAMAEALREIILAIGGQGGVRSSGESALATLRICYRLVTQTGRERKQ